MSVAPSRPRSLPGVLAWAELPLACCAFGVFFCALVTVFLWARQDDFVMRQIVTISKANELRGLAKFRRLMSVTRTLMLPRLDFYGRQALPEPSGFLPRAPSEALLTAQGACGDFALVFTRLLQVSGERAKLMQMICRNGTSCHVITEVDLNGKWIVMDSILNFSPTDRQGNPLSADEVRKDWSHVKLELLPPPHLHRKYDYQRVIGTNWNKFGAVSRALYSVLRAIGMSDLDGFSLRSYVLNPYWAVFFGLLAIGGLVFPLWIRRIQRKYGAPSNSAPAD